MTKNDLARELAVSEKLHLSTAVKAVDGILRIINESLAKGDNIYLRGLGTFEVKATKEKKARRHQQRKDRYHPCRSHSEIQTQ
ncbi:MULTISPECIES: HU family DNA-binding protein [Muribaculaceae]|uniref:HU family DNA-binding protein n=1 Tax=Muribaculaceae TaxID=2005473 RepID=UPI0026485C5A|nr:MULTISPECIES: HU family DNA-binding protein [Muribaculaceae]